MLNNKGPNIDPWGTLLLNSAYELRAVLILTRCKRWLRQATRSSQTDQHAPYAWSSAINRLWGKQSKAFAKSIKKKNASYKSYWNLRRHNVHVTSLLCSLMVNLAGSRPFQRNCRLFHQISSRFFDMTWDVSTSGPGEYDGVIKWNHFRVTDRLCGEFTGHRWIPHTKTSDAELWCFLWSAPE